MEVLFFILAGLILVAGAVYEVARNTAAWRERTDPVPKEGLRRGAVIENRRGTRVKIIQAVSSEVDGRLLHWIAVDDYGARWHIDRRPDEWRLAR